MWNMQGITTRLRQSSLLGEAWGLRGAQAVERIERGLNIGLGNQLRGFTMEVGNIRVDPFNLVLAGDDAGSISAVTETLRLWNENPQQGAKKAIKLMEHAGEIYLYSPDTERVCAYDALRPVAGEETLFWESFDQFMDWVFTEAEAMPKDTRFTF